MENLVARALTKGDAEGDRDKFAVIALGGYGREEMCPHSDVDIMFFYPARQSRELAEKLQKVMTVQVLEYSPDGFCDWHIDIGAGPDQRLDAVIAAVAGGIQQRGQSPDGTILTAGLRGKLVRPVAIQRARLDVGALGKE